MRRPYEESQRCVCLSQHGFCSTIEELRNTRQHDASARLSFNAHTRKNDEEVTMSSDEFVPDRERAASDANVR
jgi:hypothetical protein